MKVIVLLLVAIILLSALSLNTPDVYVESPGVQVNLPDLVPDIIIPPQVPPDIYVTSIIEKLEYKQRYTPELVTIVMQNKVYPWPMGRVDKVEYQVNGLWLVTVEFTSFSKQYVFDEVSPCH